MKLNLQLRKKKSNSCSIHNLNFKVIKPEKTLIAQTGEKIF